MDKVEALLDYLESEGDGDLEVTDAGWCLEVSDGREYRVLDDAGRREALESELRDETAQYYNTSFLSAETGLPVSVFDRLCDGSGDANEAVVALIDALCGMERFIDDAVREDGWGHYMSGYDGEEIELGGGLYAYRHN